MHELPRNLSHLYLLRNGRAEPYTSKLRVPRRPLPQRDRETHADDLNRAISAALAAAAEQRAQRVPGAPPGDSGFYLDFELPPGSEDAAQFLENRRKRIELVAFHQEASTAPATATVFVPDTAADFFLKKVDAYRTENVKPRKAREREEGADDESAPGRPKNEDLIARIQTVALAAVRSVYTDDPTLFPRAGERIWWEVWIRHHLSETFDAACHRLEIQAQPQGLSFPERDVRLVFGDEITLARLFLNSSAVAELRHAKDTPALFVEWPNTEQAAWATDLIARVTPAEDRTHSVCLLDTGVTQAHPLLAPSLDPDDLHLCDPTWFAGDSHGHGTNMAGTALYGDLMPLLSHNGPVQLTHCLESVKILPDEGNNAPKLYGAITGEAVARAEIRAPDRRRAVCLAATSDFGTNRGEPSSWSAAVDQLCFGDGDTARLMLISAGNIRSGLSKTAYPARNEAESIENPAQAWNAITVGAFTEKTTITDASYQGWEPVAPPGDLCPTSRTSVSWARQWPIKPDVVLEGGNWASSGDLCDCPDDLGILTTYRDPTLRHFDIFRDTSAATALGSNLASRIWAAMPQRWPETIRALVIHSAEWTPAMREQFALANSEQQKRNFLRKFGYGVPNYDRAVLSAVNDMTLIAEDELQPLHKDGSRIKSHFMNLHELPWPKAELEQLGETEVELRITLSYFVEPNPGALGWLRRHRYPSHALRFAMNRALEPVDTFRRRINAAAAAEEEGAVTTDTGPDGWDLGRVRNVGSIHSDYWRGPGIDLARRSVVAVYPIGGWWKENQSHERYDRKVKYALVVSIRAANAEVDIYTSVKNRIDAAIQITT